MTATTTRIRRHTVSFCAPAEAPIAYTITPPTHTPPPCVLLAVNTDIASATVSRPTLISRSEIPMDADLRMLDERMYSVGHTRVTLRLWQYVPDGRPAGCPTGHAFGFDPDRECGVGTQYILELSGGGCRRKLLWGCDYAHAVALCDRLVLARLSPLHLEDVLADGDLFDA